MPMMPMRNIACRVGHSPERGVTLVEVLIGTFIVIIACIGSLTYFAYVVGSVGKTGYRRAALERARERLEELMASSNISQLQPPNGQPYWLTCSGSPCTWTRSAPGVRATQLVSVDDLPSQTIETTVQWVDDPYPPAGTATLDTVALGVKVWFTRNTATDDDFNRVYVRTLRTL